MASSLPNFAAGVSIPSCHFGTTKTSHKTSIIMARSTQRDELASRMFASPPPPSVLIWRNGVTTRRGLKTTVNAAPQDVEFQTEGIPEKTIVEILDFNKMGLTLDDQAIWEGNADDLKEIIKDKKYTFTHQADPREASKVLGSVGGVEYRIKGTGFKLIVAWANPRNLHNRVYTLITNASANWNTIEKELYKSDARSDSREGDLWFHAEIDPDSAAPRLRAVFFSGNVDEAQKTINDAGIAPFFETGNGTGTGTGTGTGIGTGTETETGTGTGTKTGTGN